MKPYSVPSGVCPSIDSRTVFSPPLKGPGTDWVPTVIEWTQSSVGVPT